MGNVQSIRARRAKLAANSTAWHATCYGPESWGLRRVDPVALRRAPRSRTRFVGCKTVIANPSWKHREQESYGLFVMRGLSVTINRSLLTYTRDTGVFPGYQRGLTKPHPGFPTTTRLHRHMDTAQISSLGPTSLTTTGHPRTIALLQGGEDVTQRNQSDFSINRLLAVRGLHSACAYVEAARSIISEMTAASWGPESRTVEQKNCSLRLYYRYNLQNPGPGYYGRFHAPPHSSSNEGTVLVLDPQTIYSAPNIVRLAEHKLTGNMLTGPPPDRQTIYLITRALGTVTRIATRTPAQAPATPEGAPAPCYDITFLTKRAADEYNASPPTRSDTYSTAWVLHPETDLTANPPTDPLGDPMPPPDTSQPAPPEEASYNNCESPPQASQPAPWSPRTGHDGTGITRPSLTNLSSISPTESPSSVTSGASPSSGMRGPGYSGEGGNRQTGATSYPDPVPASTQPLLTSWFRIYDEKQAATALPRSYLTRGPVS
eukprot:g80405.t1